MFPWQKKLLEYLLSMWKSHVLDKSDHMEVSFCSKTQVYFNWINISEFEMPLAVSFLTVAIITNAK
jgi:hypothetical protein